ncbi:hypothetical protein J437_LFUL007580 [Ladona fulva]|uniref:CRIB domain-containing protein n=1 Tax=Ladona fulva TaxID=123851 RepID=A0A8K0NYE5_LADFU|nr:hypothetical protein J437_LFUL007580 [Ladona fulva]
MAAYRGGRGGAAGLGSVADMWLQWFPCCVNQSTPQRRNWRSNGSATRDRRKVVGVPKIDRSMIGAPTNFQHTGHIGSGDIQLGTSHLRAIQTQMQSKGGYETAYSSPNGSVRMNSPSATALPIEVAIANRGLRHAQAC